MGGRLERVRAPKLMWIKSLCVLVLLAGSGCLSAGSGTGSVDSVGVLWPERGGGTSEDLPPVVMIGRIVFESETGEACCLAVDPDLLMTDLLVLDDLPTGPERRRQPPRRPQCDMTQQPEPVAAPYAAAGARAWCPPSSP